MGVNSGPDLESIEQGGRAIETALKDVHCTTVNCILRSGCGAPTLRSA